MSVEESSVKLVVLVKRKAGVSFDEFQSYYENGHAKLIRHLPATKRYFRKYLHPLGAYPVGLEGSSYDVIAELWFDNQADLEQSLQILANPEIHQENAAEEARLFDHAATRLYVVDERHSDLTANKAEAG